MLDVVFTPFIIRLSLAIILHIFVPHVLLIAVAVDPESGYRFLVKLMDHKDNVYQKHGLIQCFWYTIAPRPHVYYV